MMGKNKYQYFKSALGSKSAFVVILVIFLIISIRIAITSDFPLPYDEQYHFAIIQYYSDTISPIISSQPAELSKVGDATRLGSYLMHYLLSFPLRLSQLFTQDVQAQVTFLRLINIAFMVSAIILMRSFVARLAKSGILANLTAALFCALPAVSLLAAHVNYDNLIVLVFAAILVMAQKILTSLNEHRAIAPSHLLLFVSFALLGCLVKYTFLPIAVIVLPIVLGMVIRKKALPKYSTLQKMKWRAILPILASGLLFIGSAGLFLERYATNAVMYGSLQPDCDQVQPINVCIHYGPWARNHTLKQTASLDKSFEALSPVDYASKVWAPLMLRGLGGVNKVGSVPYITKPILVILLLGSASLVLGAVIALVAYGRRNLILLVTMLAIGLYVAALLQRNYSEYLAFHQIIAVQGRYMLPFIIPLTVMGVMGLRICILQSGHLSNRFVSEVRKLRKLEPHEAYERSIHYSSSKLWQRSADN